MYSEEIKNRMDQEPRLRKHLFCRGYLICEHKLSCEKEYPFYGQWNVTKVGKYYIYTHPLTNAFVQEDGHIAVAIIGHAYNPYTGDIDENSIAGDLCRAYSQGNENFFDKVNELTGVYVVLVAIKDELLAVQDCGGQKMLYFGLVQNQAVMTSMPQLAGDVYGLIVEEKVKTLLESKGYYRGSGFLPGNMSPYRELTRLGSNTYARLAGRRWHIHRFFPNSQLIIAKTQEQQDNVVARIRYLMSQNIALTLKKWPRVGLSLTGGIDSKTTLACASDYLDRCHIYSFISKDSEKLDADAASEICKELGVPHHLYEIPQNPDEIPEYDFLRKVIEHNTSYLCKLHENEMRKYIWLEGLDDFDVEIKSDISEIGRAYTTRKYYKVKMPRVLAPRHLTIGQGRYFMEPKATKIADDAYAKFMDETRLVEDIYGYTMHDLSYWEVRMSAWASTSLTSQEFFHDITIPYNNRNLMELFLRFPVSLRMEDIPHKCVMREANQRLAKLDIQIKDSYFGNKRMLLETVYYYYATHGNFYGKK